MIQNIIALTVVFSVAGYIVYSTLRSMKAKKVCNCDGCSGCEIKNLVKNKDLGSLKMVRNK